MELRRVTEPVIIGSATLYNMDCMEFMASQPDNAFDLAIVDPPYGLDASSVNGSGKLKGRALNTGDLAWDVTPPPEYFQELFRVSKNQIIWGGNYFALPPTRGFVVWDKLQPWPNFSAAEYAWMSMQVPSKIFKFDNRTGDKIHPTQKPVNLYEWLLATFGEPGFRILDTHIGSASIAVATNSLGYELTGCEINPAYFQKSVDRVRMESRQERLFA